MHRRHLAALTATAVAVLGASMATPSPAHADSLPPPDRQALTASIDGLPDEAVTSAQVRVAGRDGAWAGRAGVRDVHTARPVPADAGFRIGSATKMFTASLVLQLVAEGRVGLDDPVQTWLPGELPASYPTITIGELLDHTSGLPMSTEDAGHEDPAWVVRHRFDWHSPRAVVRSATRQPMTFSPGTKQQYNGVNYFLAGLVVERVTGHSYAHELRSRLLRPLRLDDTYLPGRGQVRLRGPHTHGYVRVHGRLVDVTEQSAYDWAEGGMVSTTRDLDRFLGALMAGRVVPQPWVDPMLTVPDVPYEGTSGGCAQGPDAGHACFTTGLQRTALPGGPVVYGKSGGMPGSRTLVLATADGGRVLSVSLTTTGNGDGSEDERLMRVVAAALER
jgi:D-alanyl-D-alanine carboxypeptidase